MRVAVVGHTEWVQFARVTRLPTTGEIVHAPDAWEDAAGGGAMAAAELARTCGRCDFFTAVGSDQVATAIRERLPQLSVTVYAATREGASGRAVTLLDATAERTIIVIGNKVRPSGADALPWELLDGADGVYFASGDVEALRHARRAKVLVATTRVIDVLARADVQVDALVSSAHDPSEKYIPGRLRLTPGLVVSTEGAAGGRYVGVHDSGRYAAARIEGSVEDAYGAGDCFAAGLTYGLAARMTAAEALRHAANAGAAALMRAGAHGVRC